MSKIDNSLSPIVKNNVLAFVWAMGIWPAEFFSDKRKGFRFPTLCPTYFAHRLNVRLEEVKRRLRTTSDPIGQIAVDCGWRNPASLKNLFKRLYGVSMRDWR